MFALSELRAAALETLLETESWLATISARGAVFPAAPKCSAVPAKYPTLLPKEERKRQAKLGLWDSFQTASGFFPSLARFAISAAIVAGAISITLPPKDAKTGQRPPPTARASLLGAATRWGGLVGISAATSAGRIARGN